VRPLRLDLAATTDANGNASIPLKLPVTGEWHDLKIAASTTGPAEWAVLVSGSVVTFGRGRRVTLGPELVQDGEGVTVTVTGGPVAAPIIGSVTGKSGSPNEMLASYGPQPNTITLDAVAPRLQLWPDGTLAAARTGPSFTVAANVVTSFRVAIPAGATGLRVAPAVTGGGAFVFSYQLRVTGHQSGVAYFPAPFVGLGTPVFSRQPVTVPVDVEYDTQIDIGITGDASISLDFFVSALTAVEAIEVYAQQPFGVTSNVSGVTAAPWQAAGAVAPFSIDLSVAAGTTVIVAAVAGKTVYLHDLDYSISAAGGFSGNFQDTAGTVISQETFQNGSPRFRRFSGAPLGLGFGFQFKNAAVGASFAVGHLSYSQA